MAAEIVPLSLRERVGVRGKRRSLVIQPANIIRNSPRPNPLPEGEGIRTYPAAALLVVLLLASAGCNQDLETEYGQRSAPGATTSVNGTAVLGEMFGRPVTR